MVDISDIIVDGVFFVMALIVFIFIIISLFNIKNKNIAVSLSSSTFYFFLFVAVFFGLIKLYQFSNKFKAKQRLRGK